MERKLFDWYSNNINNGFISSSMIKEKALEFRTKYDFIASKGWMEKFKRKIKEKNLQF